MDADSRGSFVGCHGGRVTGAIQHKDLYTIQIPLIVLNQISLKLFLENILTIIFPTTSPPVGAVRRNRQC